MKVLAEPRIHEWVLRPGSVPAADRVADRAFLKELLNQNSLLLGGPQVIEVTSIVATGHQAWLWHPGILAKDVVTSLTADRMGATTFHLVVDQDVHEALVLDVPIYDGDTLRSQRVNLAPENLTLPSGSQPAADLEVIQSSLDALTKNSLAADIGSLRNTIRTLPLARTLAEQVGAWTGKLMEPWTGSMPLLFATQLNLLPSFDYLVQRMLADARQCAAIYNRAVVRHFEARVSQLVVTRDRVELPLWALGWQQPRLRVFADLSGSRPVLALESGEVIDVMGLPLARTRPGGLQLAPRAIFMTAILRRSCCDLFIHGKGGGIYEQITEEWWRDWAKEELALMAVVSADLHLPFTVPVATRNDLARAHWWKHHLPYNMDRALRLDDGSTRRKQHILKEMRIAKGDKVRRRMLFDELREMNGQLTAAHPHAIHQAEQRLSQASVGVRNQGLALRRDWSFSLYPHEQLDGLKQAIAALQ